MSREWPSGWEDPEDVELDAEELDAETDVRLAEVAAFLATVPAPVLPGAIESRIAAALAAESAARAEDSPARAPEPAAPGPDRSRTLGPAPARARVRRFPRPRPAMVAGPLLACLLFAGLGYAISNSPSSSSSSSAASAPQAASSAAASGEQQYSSDSTGRSAAGSVASTVGFALTRSGTDYQAATLAAQVRAVMAANEKKSPTVPAPGTPSNGPASAPSALASASQSLSLSVLTPSLRGCVVHFTGGAAPRLIDRARYQGTPAYVIANASSVWVVGLDCTKARPDLIASASLAS